MAHTTSTASEAASAPVESLRIADLMLGVGFAFMLAWHYLVLFSPVFGDLSGEGRFADTTTAYDYLFARQLVLYVFLALTFGGIWLRGRSQKKNAGRHTASPRLVYVTGLAAVAVSAAYTASCGMQLDIGVRLLFMALMGVAEAALMFLWLRCFVNKRSDHFLRSFSIDMIAGGLLALLICCFQWPVAPIVATIAPGLSAIVLAREARLSNAEQKEEESAGDADGPQASEEEERSDWQEAETVASPRRERMVMRRNRLMTLFVAIYAWAFGFMQGAYIAANVPLLMVNNAVVLLGIAVAGTLIFMIPRKLDATLSIDMMHRFSLILFVLGAVIIGWFQLGDVPLVISQIAMLAGFNLFDFGVLVYGIEEHRLHQRKGQHVIDRARPIVYLCLTAGLLIGHFVLRDVASQDAGFALTVICGISIIVLVATTMMPFYNFEGGGDGEGAQAELPDPEQCINCSHAMLSTPVMLPTGIPPVKPEIPTDWQSPWRRACTEIAQLYQLSPRETEIFFMVAKGRNADYIQQELVISTHTAKTHIANIYRKLEVHSSQELLDLVEEARTKN